MKPCKRIAVGGACIVVFGSLAGCASSPPPRELLDARAIYSRAQQGPASNLAPSALQEAKVALEKAEKAYDDEPEADSTQDLAYIAERKAQLAEAQASSIATRQAAEQIIAQQRVAQAEQLNQARQQLGTMGAQLEAQREARQTAERQAQEAMDKLKSANVAMIAVEQRGTVITVPGEVLFGVGQSNLRAPAKNRLNEVATALRDQKGHEIIVQGYTDSSGSEDKNMVLSEKRAGSVRDYLVSQGVDESRVRAEGKGEADPIASNDTQSGRAANRRVEIIVRPLENPQQEMQQQEQRDQRQEQPPGPAMPNEK